MLLRQHRWHSALIAKLGTRPKTKIKTRPSTRDGTEGLLPLSLSITRLAVRSFVRNVPGFCAAVAWFPLVWFDGEMFGRCVHLGLSTWQPMGAVDLARNDVSNSIGFWSVRRPIQNDEQERTATNCFCAEVVRRRTTMGKDQRMAEERP